MRRFECTPDRTIVGAALEVYYTNEQKHMTAPLIERYLKRYNYDGIEPETLYPLQMVLDALKEIDENNQLKDMVALGMSLASFMPFREHVKTIPQAFYELNYLARVMFPNTPDEERYLVTRYNNHQVVLVDNNIGPHDLSYGYMYAVARRFSPAGSIIEVQRTFLCPEDPNEDGAIYNICW